MLNRRRYLPFGVKLMLSYLLLVLVPVMAIGYYAYNVSVDALRRKTSENIHGTLMQIRDNVGYQVDDLERIANSIYFNYTLQDYLRRYDEGWYTYESTRDFIMPTLANTLNYTHHNVVLSLFLHNDTFPEIYYSDNGENPLIREKRYEIHHYGNIRNDRWLRQLPVMEEGFGRNVWRQVDTDERYGNVSLLRRLDDIKQDQEIGLLRIVIRIENVLQAIDHRPIGEAGILYAYDESGRMMRSSGANAGESKGEVGDELVLSEEVPGIEWRLEARIPNSVFNESARKVRTLTIVICLVSTVLLSCVGMLLSTYFSKRIHKVLRLIDAYREGDFQKRIAYSSNDEFGDIAQAFNEMGDNIDELIRDNYIANLRKKEAELETLQAQINPHFLYNTLSSISRLGKLGQIDTLHEMVLALAKFYRLSLNEGRIETTVEREVEHVRAYIDIQTMKYGSRLAVNYEIDEAALPYRTVRIILQPFVENVLEHAWGGDRIGLLLRVVKRKDQIEFSVIDDGAGMSLSLIEQIFDPNGVGVGYGIRNVDSRIKLHYSGAYGVTIKSQVGAGTEVSISIPLSDPAG